MDELDSNRTYEYLNHLRVLDSNNEKTKQRLVDPVHMIEFFRKQPHDTSGDSDDSDDDDSASSAGTSANDEEEEEDDANTLLEGDTLTSDTVSDEDDIWAGEGGEGFFLARNETCFMDSFLGSNWYIEERRDIHV